MAFNVEYVYLITDKFSGPLNRIADQVAAFDRKARNTAKGLKALSERVSKTATQFDKLGAAIGGVAILAGFKKFVNQSVRVEDALADLVRVGDLTTSQLDFMESSMESLSETLGKDKIGLLEQAFEGLKMGIPVDELTNFVELAARTAVAFDMMDAEAGRSLGSLRAKLGMNTGQLNHLMDSVNFVADNFAATGDKMINIIERTSGTMATLNFPPQVIAGLAGFADQIEVTQQLAGSGLNQMFAKMKQNPKLVQKLMTDPIAALNDEFIKFAKIDPARRFTQIEKTFGLEAARFVEKAINKVDLFNETMDAAASDRAFGSMMREMENRAGRTSTLIAKLGDVSKNTFEAIGDALKPALKAFTSFFTRVLGVLKELIKAHPGALEIPCHFCKLTKRNDTCEKNLILM